MNTPTAPVALVTGANKGIGLGLVKQLANAGWTVYLGSRDAARGHAARDSLPAGLDIRVLALDVTDARALQAATDTVQQGSGKLDVLINNAGIALDVEPPSKATLESLRGTFETNVFGPVLVTQAMLPLLRAGTLKRIVNVSSELGSATLHGDPNFKYAFVNGLSYCSSKSALNAFTVLLSKELYAEGFAVNAVNPGYTATDLNGHSGTLTVEQAATTVARVALSELGTGSFFTEGGRLPW
ncbi:NAD(P)-dependent dehydrogenase, short-chain alcohol dehydrogenase family [Pseudoxanthomonas sp. GM95]|uniref:SDR family oxidoreductase n=1 Tax=Pseudoxanthomonas sp. GM95 TaxID=1881043 RepID=UPI0008B95D2E|nr:SDR family oxidoreductase [Pseudoxanthomonas sp. GM95]SEM27233.1 NAD(P)-dependent dehydrogenase, short-chain alcohol dehydrogenase family [Pseudoxanthomonas sp. GM95]